MHRPTVGVLAVLLVFAGFAAPQFDLDPALAKQLQAACWRVGLLLGAVWLAHPVLWRLQSGPVMWALAVLVVVLAIRPRLFPLAIGVLLAFALLRPRVKKALETMRS